MIGMKRTTLAVVLLLVVLTSARAGERRNIVLDLGNGEELPLTVILPSLYEEDGEHPVIFALPPGAGDRNMVNAILANYWTDEGDRRGYILVSPAVLGRSLEGRGHEVLDAVFTWMDENLSYDRTRVTLAGQSNGASAPFSPRGCSRTASRQSWSCRADTAARAISMRSRTSLSG